MTGSDKVYPVALLIEELKHEDVALRLHSIQKLNFIASSLGAGRTRTELIPFLYETCMDDEDDVLRELAEQLGEFISAVGGIAHAGVLLKPLEKLCSVEETSVRDEAVKSLNKIVKQLSSQQVEKEFLPILHNLSTSKWASERSSAPGLYSIAYTKVGTDQTKKLRTSYGALCKDSTPNVRKAAAKYLGDFAQQMKVEEVHAEVIPMFNQLKNDHQDSVRLLAIDNCAKLGRIVGQNEVNQHILPTVKNCATDTSWRVRYMVAEKFKEICEAMGPAITKEKLVNHYVDLCKDPEVEVRTSAAFHVAEVCSLLPNEQIVESVLPALGKLVDDKSEHVRASLAKEIMGLANLLVKAETIQLLLPHFLTLLKDEYPDVRLNIISNLEAVNRVIGVERLSQSLLPAIMDLAEDKNWRVRKAIIGYIPLLSSQLGVDFFNNKLSPICMTWLTDSVYLIREAASDNLIKLTEEFGSEWCAEYLLPKLEELNKCNNYLYRMTALNAIGNLATVLDKNVVESKIVPLIVNLSNDPVPNVRFNVAQTLEKVIPVVGASSINQHIKPCIEKLQKDKDYDVIHFASSAAATLA